MGMYIATCTKPDCGMSFKLHKHKVLSVQHSMMSKSSLREGSFFVTMDCKHCGKQLKNLLHTKDMRKLGYNDGELRVVLSGGMLVGR